MPDSLLQCYLHSSRELHLTTPHHTGTILYTHFTDKETEAKKFEELLQAFHLVNCRLQT